MQNRVFFPQAAIDQWGVDGAIDLTASELILLADGRRYKIEEAVRIVAEVSGANDAHQLLGKVKPKPALDALGAEIMENSMILGDNAYDVVPGWAGTPQTPFAEHLASPERAAARGGKPEAGSPPTSEEELLQRFASGTL
jgi:hypothetical protein